MECVFSTSSGDRRDDRNNATGSYTGFFALQCIDVFVTHVDSDERADFSGVIKQMGLQAAVLRDEIVDDPSNGASIALKLRLIIGEFSQRRRDDEFCHGNRF